MSVLDWIDNWIPSVDGIRLKEKRAKQQDTGGGGSTTTAGDGILTDHKTGASAELAPRAGQKAGERPEVKT